MRQGRSWTARQTPPLGVPAARRQKSHSPACWWSRSSTTACTPRAITHQTEPSVGGSAMSMRNSFMAVRASTHTQLHTPHMSNILTCSRVFTCFRVRWHLFFYMFYISEADICCSFRMGISRMCSLIDKYNIHNTARQVDSRKVAYSLYLLL